MATTYAVGQRITASLLQSLADGTINRPVVRLVQQSGQAIANNTDTAISFGAGSEVIDTHGYHDEVTNNTRITPLIQGYYMLTGLLYLPANTDWQSIQVLIKQNGATNLPSSSRHGPNATSSARSVQVICDNVFANGSTDFFESFANQVNGAAASRTTTSSGGSTACLFTAVLQRPV